MSISSSPPGRPARRPSCAGEPFAFSGTPLYYEDLAFAVAEGETDWVKLLDYAIAAMREEGTLTDLSKRVVQRAWTSPSATEMPAVHAGRCQATPRSRSAASTMARICFAASGSIGSGLWPSMISSAATLARS